MRSWGRNLEHKVGKVLEVYLLIIKLKYSSLYKESSMLRKAVFYFGVSLSILFVKSTFALQYDNTIYEVYFGDFNDDGKDSDIYIHGIDKFILLHGDIITPLLINGADGFVYYEDGGSTASALDLDLGQLDAFEKSSLGVNHYFSDVNNDGVADLVITLGGNEYVLSGSTSASFPVASISSARQVIQYKYDALGRLTYVEDNINENRDYDYDAAGNRTSVTEGSPE